MTDRKDAEFLAAYAVVGELILITNALDHQLNLVLIEVLPLTDSNKQFQASEC